MGNCFVYGKSSSNSKMAKLIDTRDGTLRQVNLPVKAAELMLEIPGHVISPADQLRMTKRVLPMRADDEMEGGKVYALFPVSRINRHATEGEIAAVEAACRMRPFKNRSCGSSQVSPTTGEDKMEEERGGEEEVTVVLVKGRRRWSPVLEPISEVP